MKDQRTEVSALLDNELEDHAAPSVLNATIGDKELRQAWQVYVLIGDHLSGEVHRGADITANVMARIHEEPVVLAPRNQLVVNRQHPLLALAASVAGVAMVGWLALSGTPQSPLADGRLAAVSPAPMLVKMQVEPGQEKLKPVPTIQTQHDLNEYLLAHQTQASTFRLGHSAEHVRAVALTEGHAQP